MIPKLHLDADFFNCRNSCQDEASGLFLKSQYV
ncbi:MAG: hypothetical protein ACJA1H_002762, partial [Glaciecola sp.]